MLGAAALLVGCADQPLRTAQPIDELRADMARAAAQRPATAATGNEAPVLPTAPIVPALPAEPRFDLIVNGAPVRDVFLSMVTDTRYSMLMHPDVTGILSVTLKGVTLREALDSIRDVYGFDYKIEGRRVTVFPPTMQTRIFMVNYLHNQRVGRSDVRISSGAAPANNNNGNGSSGTTNGNASAPSNIGNNNGSGNGNGNAQSEGSQVSTSSRTDFWGEITEALHGIVGKEGGRMVIASPQAGTIAVRAMPDELRQIESFLRSTRLSVERQVMLEAKIVEVELRDGYQSGIDWSYLRNRGSVGQSTSYGGNPLVSNLNGLPVLPSSSTPLLPDSMPMPGTGSGTLGLALATNGFQAVLGFLETHGDLQILSSPRVATLNNQKAVLKVGTDDYFVTNISGGTITTATTTTAGTITPPTITLTPFFSGIALDVTPQIDEANMITLHVHPSVTSVRSATTSCRWPPAASTRPTPWCASPTATSSQSAG